MRVIHHLKRPAATIVALTLAAAIGIVAKARAAAVCNDGQVCLYEHQGYTGSALKLGTDASDLRTMRFYNGTGANDRVSSLINNSSRTIAVCVAINYDQACRTIAPHTQVRLFDNAFNDTISSVILTDLRLIKKGATIATDPIHD
jgi:Peptidase inhibitor family I36